MVSRNGGPTTRRELRIRSKSVRNELGWSADYEVVRARVRIDNQGGVRPVELAEALLGAVPSGVRYARLGLVLTQ